ncbi:MAG: hypothetical protein HAW62_03250 [Endozoicomonadaceae bacterium]|nr:hypothetical protein [Endozoicomonadaceae bacterium]
MMHSQIQNHAIWQSRRGMLELDVLLIPFARNCFTKINDQEQTLYLELTQYEDTQLYAWLIHQIDPLDAKFKKLIQMILQQKINFETSFD